MSPITPKQKELRSKSIGSSDIAALVGMDKFKSKYDVYLQKTGKVAREEMSKAAEAGQEFEPTVLSYTEKELGKLTRNQRRRVAGTIVVTNIDAIVNASGLPVEAKTHALLGPAVDDWGEYGTDQVPERVICQCQMHMVAIDRDTCYVATWIGGRGFGIYEVPRNSQLIEILLSEADNFWSRHVIPDIPPTDSAPSLKLIRKVIRTPNKVVVFNPGDVAAYETWVYSKELLSTAKKAEEHCKASVIAALGDAEAAVVGDFGITFLESPRKGYEVKATVVRTLRTLKKGLPESFKPLLENGKNEDQTSTDHPIPKGNTKVDEGEPRSV